MAKRVFKADLSVKSIEELKNQLIDYRDNVIQAKTKELARRLAENGVEIAKANVTKLDAVFTGELMNSIHEKDGGSTKTSAIFYIVADSEHAAFVEFGAGQIGEEAPYPYPLPEGVKWEYNSGKTIFEISTGQYGWFYQKNGEWYFTQGMPSRPFMYETSLELYDIVLQTAKEVFGK